MAERLLIVGVVYGAFLLTALWRPNAARILAGTMFFVAGAVVNLPLMLLAPDGYVAFGSSAFLAPYRWLFSEVVGAIPALFVGLLAAYQVVTALLILSRGRAVRLGLLAAIVFLLAITPLGLDTVLNPLFALALGLLLRHHFDRPLLPVLGRLAHPGQVN